MSLKNLLIRVDGLSVAATLLKGFFYEEAWNNVLKLFTGLEATSDSMNS